MRRKHIIFVLIFIFAVCQLIAAFRMDQSRAISLQGAVGAVSELYIKPISAQTTSYRFGMPFDIQDISVSSTAADGRPIAHWSVLSNTKFIIEITTMEKLHHVDAASTDEGFDYTLTFTYDLSYFEGSEQKQDSGEPAISTFDDNKSIDIVPNTANSSSFIGSVDGTIYFKFAVDPDSGESSTALDNRIDAAQPGSYEALVVLTVEDKG